MSTLVTFILLVLSPFYFWGCAMATWPGRVYQNPTLSLSNYHTFSFSLPVTANIMEDKAREKIIKLLEKSGYRYIEARETVDFVVEERIQWEERIGYTPPRVEYTPIYTRTTIIYIPSYIPERPYTYYEFSASLTFYDGASREKIYEGSTEGTASYLDPGEIYVDLMKQGNLPASLGRARAITRESYKVYTTKYSRIYHRANCPALGAELQRYSPGAPPPGLGAEGLIEFGSAEEAGQAGAVACQKCRP